ncbi:MAG TPA: indolepyruvate oxidoreductase subunit beta [Vicinamibacterales bacterium]|nr:indolepyruvate oxidoreductase subunit beta [Vicinamibacterales bacterium]
MKFDIILAGVGGQGVLSLSGVIAAAALQEGLAVKQSEVHGMSQRGGAVLANLRMGSAPIASDLVPVGCASLILSMEPLESLRYLRYLSPSGAVITSTEPVRNIPDYPDLAELLGAVRSLPHAVLIDSERLARAAGSARAANMALVGAASAMLPLKVDTLERCIAGRFGAKGQAVVDLNLKAFRAGREAAA